MLFVRRFTFIVLFWTAAAPTARAAGQSSTATLSANVSPVADLSISSASVSFPDADPDTIPQIPALGGPLLITAKARANSGGQVVLSVQAADDLRSGVTLIPVTNLTWTATGPGFVAGTMSKTASVTVASWIGSGVRSGSQQLFFRNLWTHPTGSYTVSLLYTLSAP
jgi:hypothetical protein